MENGQQPTASVRLDLMRQGGRFQVTVKVGAVTALVDEFDDFCELDKRMSGRLGILWKFFRDEVRARCDR